MRRPTGSLTQVKYKNTVLIRFQYFRPPNVIYKASLRLCAGILSFNTFTCRILDFQQTLAVSVGFEITKI